MKQQKKQNPVRITKPKTRRHSAYQCESRGRQENISDERQVETFRRDGTREVKQKKNKWIKYEVKLT